MWATIDDGTYQHLFSELASPYYMQGKLIQWASICARAFAIEEPKPNPKKLKCRYCVERENGHHE